MWLSSSRKMTPVDCAYDPTGIGGLWRDGINFYR
jgi:hypothetical protein